MKKNLSVALIICMTVLSMHVSAQEKTYKKVRTGFGLEAALPIGSLSNAYNLGAGASFRLGVALDEKSAITGSVGAMAFIPKSISGTNTKAGLNIPIKAGYRYMLGKNVYALAEAGITSAKVYYPSTSGSLTSASSTHFTYAANIGTQLGKFNASVRYEAYSSAGFIGLRLGFGL